MREKLFSLTYDNLIQQKNSSQDQRGETRQNNFFGFKISTIYQEIFSLLSDSYLNNKK